MTAWQSAHCRRWLFQSGLFHRYWLLDEAGQFFKIENLLPHLEMSVQVGSQQHLKARLLARRVPSPIAEQRRCQALKEAKCEGQTVSEARLVLLGWEVFITNLPAALASSDEVFVLARVRWQIELLFKLCKSEGGLAESRSANPWRVLCEF